VGCWHGYLSGARCRLAYSPADATALTVSCFSKIQIGFTFLVPAHPGSPGKRAVKRVCVCVCAFFHKLICNAVKRSFGNDMSSFSHLYSVTVLAVLKRSEMSASETDKCVCLVGVICRFRSPHISTIRGTKENLSKWDVTDR